MAESARSEREVDRPSLRDIASPRIPVAEPALIGREAEYVRDCLESTWISSTGTYIDRFEQGFAEYCGARYALSCSNGTVALHLALLALGVGPGDEVICPTLTYVATANCVTYCRATPVFVDSEPRTWNVDPERIAGAITPRTRAIIVVHLYGHPVDMDAVLAVARAHGVAVIEDAAEAHGARYKGARVGGLADVGTFSFYGNKIITTGEGGMVTTNDDEIASRVRLLKGQGQDPQRRYWFPTIGFNYRMTNIAAAIGVAQLENIDWHVGRRRENARWYRALLGESSFLDLSPEADWAVSAHWMSCAVLKAGGHGERDEVMRRMGKNGIETRPFFYPMHVLPPHSETASRGGFPVAESLAERGMNLPSGATLTQADAEYVAEALEDAVSSIFG